MAIHDVHLTVRRILSREKPAIAEALNLVESQRNEDQLTSHLLIKELDSQLSAQKSHRIGFTGPPGVGKSTLVGALAQKILALGHTVAVIAVDPTSIYSGGSLLGDRARMPLSPNDPNCYVRSYATGGEAGGLTHAAHAAISVLSAAYEYVFIETTGVGQTETDITLVADTVALVIQPGSGDTLQFLKAGIMEIPDIIIIQKADHEDLAKRAMSDVQSALRTAHDVGMTSQNHHSLPPVLTTSARTGSGIENLVSTLKEHRKMISDQILNRRVKGSIHWAIKDFLRLHGIHGMRALGGHDILFTLLEEKYHQHFTAVELTHFASNLFLQNQSIKK